MLKSSEVGCGGEATSELQAAHASQFGGARAVARRPKLGCAHLVGFGLTRHSMPASSASRGDTTTAVLDTLFRDSTTAGSYSGPVDGGLSRWLRRVQLVHELSVGSSSRVQTESWMLCAYGSVAPTVVPAVRSLEERESSLRVSPMRP
ncbi:uncharacterized protein LOC119326462 [Triticum dicoccoides]|uniref:uncharacterized protein LOC119326462 n=1 Tax=Triticum dicoccoides TaxID=85692 RepID=UPI000E7CA109|nr:uncharacterized protein LOC119326462 [Triticum dicoccoides]XP_044413342.1 uncharacterized protein LOC123137588 [Triticum aestivum]